MRTEIHKQPSRLIHVTLPLVVHHMTTTHTTPFTASYGRRYAIYLNGKHSQQAVV